MHGFYYIMRKLKLSDFLAALQSHDLWLYLAWQDIRLRYRLSKIGPLWITLSMTIFVLVLGVVYSKLFKADIREYLPHLAAGFVVWGFISGMLGEFPNMFIDNAAYIKDIKINPFSILFRVIARHTIIFGHNALIMLGIYLYFGINPGLTVLLALPGFIIVVLNLTAIGVSLGLIGARFRDVAQIAQSMIQVLFFVTPIIWLPRLVPADSWIMLVNPFVYYLDLTRSPFLGNLPAFESLVVSVFTLLLYSALAAVLYWFKAKRIPFWI